MPSLTSPIQYAATAVRRAGHETAAMAETVSAAHATVLAIVRTFGMVARLVVAQQEQPLVAHPATVLAWPPELRSQVGVKVMDVMLRG